jgi:hypothetical protein
MWSLKSWHFRKRNVHIDDFINAQQELIQAMVLA